MATKKSEKAITDNEVTNNTDNVVDIDDMTDSINQLKKENEDLKKQLQAIIDSLNQKDRTSNVVDDTATFEKEYPEPPLNKNIKIISLFHGSLNLSDGLNAKLSFSKYGQTKNCLYGKLIDIVNHDMKFAKEGLFYIADEAAVYHLGLSDDYKHIQPKEVLDNICEYDDSIIKNIGNTLTDEQKENLSFGLAKRMYEGENFDLNKIKILSDAININIEGLCQEMKDTERASRLQNGQENKK